MSDKQCIALNLAKTVRDGAPSRCTLKAVYEELCSGHHACINEEDDVSDDGYIYDELMVRRAGALTSFVGGTSPLPRT